jgi:hypothetical protein
VNKTTKSGGGAKLKIVGFVKSGAVFSTGGNLDAENFWKYNKHNIGMIK